MSVQVTRDKWAGMRWLTLAGPPVDVFRELGRIARDDIQAVLAGLPERRAVEAYLDSRPGAARLTSLVAVSERDEPEAVQELYALADGAEVPRRDLLALNLRGDLGALDGTGCTDLAWRPGSSVDGPGVIAHNEDGAPALAERLLLLTLHLEGHPAVTVHWYPGFVPSNTVVATEAGLVWGINHLQVQAPAPGAGRHFVARSLQRTGSLDDALAHLRDHPSAGGFAYTIGEIGSSRIANVETAGGRCDVIEVPPAGDLHWHTNHLRRLPSALEASRDSHAGTDQLGQLDESRSRGTVAARLTPDPSDVGRWMLAALAGEHSAGLHRTALENDPLMTLTTTVTGLPSATVTVRHHTGATATLELHDYLRLG